MPKYPFLSDEWVAEAHRIYAEAEASGALAATTFAPVRVNLVITDAPFSDRPIDAHVDTSSGQVAISTGHLPGPDVTVSMGYGTARSLFVAGDVQSVMQAFLGGRVRVDGDLSKLLDPRSGIWPGAPPSPPVADQPGAAVSASGAAGAGGGGSGESASGAAGASGGGSGGTSAAGGGGPARPGPGLPGAEALALATRLKEITE
ncbi:MAG: hypothetical protein ABSE77_01855 [Acidimicrobiales bacterium]|jgi:hypothetical protein